MLERPCSAWLWLLLLLVFDVVFRVDCFNLDMRWPIVKRGELDSYFGYSVAGHQSLDENGAVNQSWILVGAPLGQNLQPGTKRSGALWKCPLTSLYSDCEQVVTDGKRRVNNGPYDPSK
uniref:Integrin alpha-PS1 n=1 Tax=Sipha flava TaxID=143950 RepID=A0A2S2QIP6_9HEMI